MSHSSACPPGDELSNPCASAADIDRRGFSGRNVRRTSTVRVRCAQRLHTCASAYRQGAHELGPQQ